MGLGNVLDITGANESGPGWIHVTSAVAQHILRRAFTFVTNDGMCLLSTLDLESPYIFPVHMLIETVHREIFQILLTQMPPKLQDEAESAEAQMDQGVSYERRQRAGL